MRKNWNIIISWLKENALPVFNDLFPGVDASELSAAENKIGAPFPADMKQSLLIHNGQRGAAAPLMGDWQLMYVKIIVERWEMLKTGYDNWKGEKGNDAENDWNYKMIPIAHNGAGDFICINLDKGKETYGEIKIYSRMEGLDKKVQEKSYTEWLGKFADDLAAGKYKYEDDQMIRIN